MNALAQGESEPSIDGRSYLVTSSVLQRMPREAQVELVARLTNLVIRLALEADDLGIEDEETLPPGMLRAERDGFVRVWRRPTRNDGPRPELRS